MVNILHSRILSFIVVLVGTCSILVLVACKDKASPQAASQDTVVVQGLQIIKTPLVQRVVGSGLVSLGDTTAALQASTIQRSVPLLVRIAVAERFVSLITKQDDVQVHIPSLDMTIDIATIRTIGTTADKNIGSVPVIVEWNADAKKDATLIKGLSSGLVSDVTIMVDDSKATYPIVPKSVLLQEDNAYYVLLASRPLENSTIYKSKVTIGNEFAGNVEITDGITPNDDGTFPVLILSRLASVDGATVTVNVIGETKNF